MDYERIYREFIADRKTREAGLTGYTEKHHILPRSLGGGNEPENLIRLTAEDHYFAHLLLAKWIGGGQWSAVFCMAMMVVDATQRRRLFAARYMVGVARRRRIEHLRAILTGQRREYRDVIATLHHEHLGSVTGSRTELAKLTGLSLASVSRLCNGKQGKSDCGWYLNPMSAATSREARRAQGRRYAANVAGANRLSVKRLDCGTVYPSLTDASRACGTNTSNIARAIRTNGKAAGARWSYLHGQADYPQA